MHKSCEQGLYKLQIRNLFEYCQKIVKKVTKNAYFFAVLGMLKASKNEVKIMQISSENYAKLVQKNSPKSRKFRDIFAAFSVGGLICATGEIFYYAFTVFGCDEKVSRASASIMIVFFTAVLTGIGVFDKIAKFAGAGTLVPITGFANAVVSPAIEFKKEGYILGVAAKMFTIAGPVLVYGINAAIAVGMLGYLMGY